MIIHRPAGELHLLHAILELGQENLVVPGQHPLCEFYANPFRTYPLGMDYERFKRLIEDGVSCYVLNTGDFMGTKVKPAHTLSILEAIVEDRAKWVSFGNFAGMKTLELPDFKIDTQDEAYRGQLRARFQDRLNFVVSRETERGGMDRLPDDAREALERAVGHRKRKRKSTGKNWNAKDMSAKRACSTMPTLRAAKLSWRYTAPSPKLNGG